MDLIRNYENFAILIISRFLKLFIIALLSRYAIFLHNFSYFLINGITDCNLRLHYCIFIL